MSFLNNSVFLDSNHFIGISVGKEQIDLHNKILINFDEYKGELHLRFHHDLVFDIISDNPKYIWDFPKNIPSSRLKALAGRCIKVINNINNQKTPYSFEYKGQRKFDKEGIYESYKSGSEYGMTCATFVLTIFDSVGINLLDWQNWVEREEDSVFFRTIMLMLSSLKKQGFVSEEHIENLKSEKNCKKIRPEEVFSSVYCKDYPMKYDCSSGIGIYIRKHLNTL